MSRMSTESNPGVQVTRSSNNVYTLLLMVAFLALAAATLYMGAVNSDRFGFSMPMGDEYKKSLTDVKTVRDDTTARAAEMARTLADARNLNAGLADTSSEPATNP